MTGRPPNILVVVADCARSDKWLGARRAARTPNLDRLARQGVALPTTIVEKPCTTPSFATLLSGLYSPRHGVHLVWGYRLPESVPLLTDLLAERGYHTYAEATGPLLAEMGLQRGFEHYEYRTPCDYLHTKWGARFAERLRGGHYREPWFILLHLWELHVDRQVAREFDRPECGTDSYERAVSSLDARLADVFAAAGDDAVIVFTGDHGEKTAAEQYREGTAVDYGRKLLGADAAEGMPSHGIAKLAGPSVFQRFYGQCAPHMKQMRLREKADSKPPGVWTRVGDRLRLLSLAPWLTLRDLSTFGAPLRLTKMLERRGLLDPQRSRRKVERFTRRMGQKRMLEMHMRMWRNSYKQNLAEGHMLHVYDYLVRVPLVIRWPDRLPEGAVHQRMVRQPDIMPTLLDLLGVEPERLGDIDGRSFRPLLEDAEWSPPPAYLSITGIPLDLELRGVRTETDKYTYGPENPELPEELYDLRCDPGETRNLAAGERARCTELRALAESLLPGARPPAFEPMTLEADDQARVERHLQELGYIE